MVIQSFWLSGWGAFIIGSLWASLLIGLGFLDIQPVTLRLLLLPALGFPTAILSIWAEFSNIAPDRYNVTKNILLNFFVPIVICFMGGALLLALLEILGHLFNVPFITSLF